MPDIEGFRAHAVLDGDITDTELQGYLDAAMGYLAASEVIAPSTTEAAQKPLLSKLYDLAVYQLATHYKERRGMVGDDPAQDAFGVQGIIHQLKGVFTGEG